ncbi:hypothetical protein SDC9_23615 [bioreactor metagenome]|uniref:Uncharacterized protein n=1 Tax=bioreactor metagenome TaxID=1076179 RepID=A0A644UFK2_9ZZZZ|nr:hypothetical protein [Methanocorpusculum sp.]
MTTKIYVRERNKIGAGVQEPRYRIAAVTGDRTDIRFSANHFRKTELESILQGTDAELIYLAPMDEAEHGKKKYSD